MTGRCPRLLHPQHETENNNLLGYGNCEFGAACDATISIYVCQGHDLCVPMLWFMSAKVMWNADVLLWLFGDKVYIDCASKSIGSHADTKDMRHIFSVAHDRIKWPYCFSLLRFITFLKKRLQSVLKSLVYVIINNKCQHYKKDLLHFISVRITSVNN